MLGFFQMPNKFFEANGAVTDMAGADWESMWGPAYARTTAGG